MLTHCFIFLSNFKLFHVRTFSISKHKSFLCVKNYLIRFYNIWWKKLGLKNHASKQWCLGHPHSVREGLRDIMQGIGFAGMFIWLANEAPCPLGQYTECDMCTVPSISHTMQDFHPISAVLCVTSSTARSVGGSRTDLLLFSFFIPSF